MSGGVFWSVYDRIMILGSLSANEWVCVPVLLVVWHRVSGTVACWSLSETGSYNWDGDLWENFRSLIVCGARKSLVDQCPELGSPTSDAQAWHVARAPRPCQPHGWNQWWQKLSRSWHAVVGSPSPHSPIAPAACSSVVIDDVVPGMEIGPLWLWLLHGLGVWEGRGRAGIWVTRSRASWDGP